MTYLHILRYMIEQALINALISAANRVEWVQKGQADFKPKTNRPENQTMIISLKLMFTKEYVKKV